MNYAKLVPCTMLAAAVLLGGCSTSTKSADTKAPAKTAQDDQAYVPVSTMGSWIPRKVKKKEDVIGTTGENVAPEAMNRVNAQGASNIPKDTQH